MTAQRRPAADWLMERVTGPPRAMPYRVSANDFYRRQENASGYHKVTGRSCCGLIDQQAHGNYRGPAQLGKIKVIGQI